MIPIWIYCLRTTLSARSNPFLPRRLQGMRYIWGTTVLSSSDSDDSSVSQPFAGRSPQSTANWIGKSNCLQQRRRSKQKTSIKWKTKLISQQASLLSVRHWVRHLEQRTVLPLVAVWLAAISCLFDGEKVQEIIIVKTRPEMNESQTFCWLAALGVWAENKEGSARVRPFDKCQYY